MQPHSDELVPHAGDETCEWCETRRVEKTSTHSAYIDQLERNSAVLRADNQQQRLRADEYKKRGDRLVAEVASLTDANQELREALDSVSIVELFSLREELKALRYELDQAKGRTV